jgi:hypothetical protein
MEKFIEIITKMTNEAKGISDNEIKIFQNSYVACQAVQLLMVKVENQKFILAVGEGKLYEELQGEAKGEYKVCPLSHENRLVLNKYLDYTAPKALGKETSTIGLGDRLGIASAGHIRAVKGKGVKPVLAQQSIRELELTGRSYGDVLDAACFAVFQEGYREGFGADGDHLKAAEDIQMALELGFTMITLDCSEKIDNTIVNLDKAAVEKKYHNLPEEVRRYYEEQYLEKTYKFKETAIAFNKESLMETVLVYRGAIDFIASIYRTYIEKAGRQIDFEISIDETLTPTIPEAHYFVANEIYTRNVDINCLAPRFCGEFQKGIDYIGDIEQFTKEFKIHAEIAAAFGYKLSIHSGSDKFMVFPVIGKYTRGKFHVKTAGTNWLEAMRVVAKVKPNLYRRMQQFALEHFEEARAYYHVTTDVTAILPLAKVADEELPNYMEDNNARQLIHITYGILLQAKDNGGNFLFKDEFFSTLATFEEEYNEALISHIIKHLSTLGM